MIERKERVAGAITAFGTTNNKQKKENSKMAVIEWTERMGVDSGDYNAVITEIEETEGQYGPQLQLQFVILDDDGQKTDQEIRGWCSMKWGPKTKLLSWAKAILGKKCPGANDPIDTDLLKGRKCDLRIEEKAGPNGTLRTYIENIYPYRSITTVADEEVQF